MVYCSIEKFLESSKEYTDLSDVIDTLCLSTHLQAHAGSVTFFLPPNSVVKEAKQLLDKDDQKSFNEANKLILSYIVKFNYPSISDMEGKMLRNLNQQVFTVKSGSIINPKTNKKIATIKDVGFKPPLDISGEKERPAHVYSIDAPIPQDLPSAAETSAQEMVGKGEMVITAEKIHSFCISKYFAFLERVKTSAVDYPDPLAHSTAGFVKFLTCLKHESSHPLHHQAMEIGKKLLKTFTYNPLALFRIILHDKLVPEAFLVAWGGAPYLENPLDAYNEYLEEFGVEKITDDLWKTVDKLRMKCCTSNPDPAKLKAVYSEHYGEDAELYLFTHEVAYLICVLECEMFKNENPSVYLKQHWTEHLVRESPLMGNETAWKITLNPNSVLSMYGFIYSTDFLKLPCSEENIAAINKYEIVSDCPDEVNEKKIFNAESKRLEWLKKYSLTEYSSNYYKNLLFINGKQ